MPLPETASPCAFLRCSTVQPELQPALCAQVEPGFVARTAIHRLAASLGLPVHFRATPDGLTAADIDLDDAAPLIAA